MLILVRDPLLSVGVLVRIMFISMMLIKFTTTNCVYFSPEYATQNLDAAATIQTIATEAPSHSPK